jgi:hypothetical protein
MIQLTDVFNGGTQGLPLALKIIYIEQPISSQHFAERPRRPSLFGESMWIVLETDRGPIGPAQYASRALQG